MKLSYPLRGEDAMKLLDRAFDRAIEMSKPVQALATALEKVAEQVGALATYVAVIAHNQKVHSHAINQIWQLQQQIFGQLSERSLNMKMPEIKLVDEDVKQLEGKKSDGKDKPN